jgi:hypothetical protein
LFELYPWLTPRFLAVLDESNIILGVENLSVLGSEPYLVEDLEEDFRGDRFNLIGLPL